MIAKIYYLVGVAAVDLNSSYDFPQRVFSADEEQQAKREYDRLAKRNFDDGYVYQEAYMVRMIGEDKQIIYGNKEKLIYHI